MSDSDDEPTVGLGPSSGSSALVEIVTPSVLLPQQDGLRVRRYDLTGLLGTGGTSQVYSAQDRDLGREVAVKVVHAGNALRHELFVREARVMACLGHPNIPPIYDVGTSSGALYLTTRRITGQSLGDLIRVAPPRVEAKPYP